MTRLELEAEFDRERWDNCMVKPDCVDPQVTEWPVSDVYTAVTKEFADKAGVAMDYVRPGPGATRPSTPCWLDGQEPGQQRGCRL